MAGDALAAAIAAHLAGCSSCTDELDRLRRAAIIIGDAVGGPTPELRERTLAFVREVGRIRDGTPKQPQHRRALGGSRACRGVGCDRTGGFRALA